MKSANEINRKPSLETLFVALSFCFFGIASVIYATRGWFMPVASSHGAGIDEMLTFLLLATGSMFLLGHLVLGYLVWRFSRQRKVSYRKAPPAVERGWSIALGIIMALVAEGGVLIIGLPIFSDVYGDPPADSLTLEVTGEQFGWNVHYPGPDGSFGRTDPERISLNNPIGLDETDPAARDDLLLISEFFLPVNRPVRIRLSSKDVLHSFYLPYFRVKQDTVPGMKIDTWFVPNQEGTYELACAELCGFGHYKMRGVLHVVTEAEYQQFLEEEPPFLF